MQISNEFSLTEHQETVSTENLDEGAVSEFNCGPGPRDCRKSVSFDSSQRWTAEEATGPTT